MTGERDEESGPGSDAQMSGRVVVAERLAVVVVPVQDEWDGCAGFEGDGEAIDHAGVGETGFVGVDPVDARRGAPIVVEVHGHGHGTACIDRAGAQHTVEARDDKTGRTQPSEGAESGNHSDDQQDRLGSRLTGRNQEHNEVIVASWLRDGHDRHIVL